jgi:hypothetical protein
MGATRPLFWFCGGTPPTTPRHGGFAPLDPRFCPPPWAEGLPAFWAPLVAGLQGWATRPLFLAFGGTSPKPPGRGLRPLHPRFNQGRRRPTFFKEADFSRRERGTPPTTPRHGGFAPWTPRLPTPVGLGFASVLGPTRGGVANGGNSPPLLNLWGDTPQTPRQGACAPWTPVFAHPRGLRVRQRFGPHSWRGC